MDYVLSYLTQIDLQLFCQLILLLYVSFCSYRLIVGLITFGFMSQHTFINIKLRRRLKGNKIYQSYYAFKHKMILIVIKKSVFQYVLCGIIYLGIRHL